MMWMMLWMVLFWALVIGGVAWLFARPGRDGDSARELLRERLARGDIDVEEFRRREEVLGRDESGRGRRRWLILGGAAAFVLAVFVVVPIVVMAADGWDMWDMHGRGRDTSGSPLVRGGTEAAVTIEDFTFTPGNLEVPAGASVTWTNEDSAPHDATARNGDWETDTLSDGESDTVTFAEPGEYDYFCSIHSYIKARLVVR